MFLSAGVENPRRDMAEVPMSGVTLIKQFEGLHLDAYPDPLTQGSPYTIGWGSTRRQDGAPFEPTDRITQEDAEALLLWQLEHEFLPVLEAIPHWSSLTEPQAGALLSFAYNLGAGFYGAGDFPTITQVLETQDWHRLEYALTLYRNPASLAEEGLLRRRLSEAQVFLSGTDAVDMSVAGQTYLAEKKRTYTQNPNLSDQALQYLTAIAQKTSQKQAPDRVSVSRSLSLENPPLVGEDVRLIQEALVRAGATLTVDGVFGATTQQAVEQFQRLNGLTADGTVAEQTRTCLLRRALHLSDPPMAGTDIESIQERLYQLGFKLHVDGVFGPETLTAVEAFQRQAGLVVDGIVGSHTRRILQARQLALVFPNLRGEDVTWVQKTLTHYGLNIEVDGVFGPQTAWTIKQFQVRHYLPADGIVGARTWTTLGR